jgi:hypothetical protein
MPGCAEDCAVGKHSARLADSASHATPSNAIVSDSAELQSFAKAVRLIDFVRYLTRIFLAGRGVGRVVESAKVVLFCARSRPLGSPGWAACGVASRRSQRLGFDIGPGRERDSSLI